MKRYEHTLKKGLRGSVVGEYCKYSDHKVKHDQSHALLKEAYEAIVELCEIGMRARDQADLVEKAEQWLKENR